jgi:hypothetical protein
MSRTLAFTRSCCLAPWVAVIGTPTRTLVSTSSLRTACGVDPDTEIHGFKAAVDVHVEVRFGIGDKLLYGADGASALELTCWYHQSTRSTRRAQMAIRKGDHVTQQFCGWSGRPHQFISF